MKNDFDDSFLENQSINKFDIKVLLQWQRHIQMDFPNQMATFGKNKFKFTLNIF